MSSHMARSVVRSGSRRASGQARDPRIDQYRGALTILMVAGNFIAGVAAIPAWLKHAPDLGLTVADVVAPAFVFVIGLTFRDSFRRRACVSRGAAYRHFVVRYLSLIGIGAIISAGSTSVAHQPEDWGVLQALGVAGLLCLMVVSLDTSARIACGLALLAGYGYLLHHGAGATVRAEVHGGLVGALAWGAMLILATGVVDLMRRGRRSAALTCAVLAVVSVSVATVDPISKHRVSPSYVFVCLTLSAVVWLILDNFRGPHSGRDGLLCWWGENPLLLYLLHLPLLGLISVPHASWWYAGAGLPLAATELAVLLVVLSCVARELHRRGIHVTA